MKNHEFTAIILASGESKRFKSGNKLKTIFNGKPLIEHTMDEIKKSGRFDEIIIVSARDDILNLGENYGFKSIMNLSSSEGISSSIRLGVSNSNGEFMFFVADQPFINANLINKLLDEFDGNSIIVPSVHGEFKNPVIFPRAFKSDLLNLKGDVGGKSVIKANMNKVKKVEIEGERYFKDIDTIEDYFNLEKIVIVRGGGDIATGIIQKLFRAGFKVLVLEIEKPSCIRRTVSLCECMYGDEAYVEDMVSKKIINLEEAWAAWDKGKIPVLNDETLASLKRIRPFALVDAILAKRNLGTNKDMAPITIGVGPGFSAGEDVDVVIETNRGHDLGRLIFDGKAKENTGIPGDISGFSTERVIYSNAKGIFMPLRKIGDIVKKGDAIGKITEGDSNLEIVKSKIDGVLRGIIREGYLVPINFKIADVDPRILEAKNCFTISDKARCIGGAVLEAILFLERRKFHEK